MVGQIEGSEVTAPASKGGFDVREHWIDSAVVVAVSGALDMLTAPQLAEAIDIAVSAGPDTLIVDLTDVDFLGSAGMNAVVAAYRAFTPLTRFAVVADGPATSRPLKLIGIDEIIDLYPNLDDALAALPTP
jgi:anti-sigma B factor antagonist